MQVRTIHIAIASLLIPGALNAQQQITPAELYPAPQTIKKGFVRATMNHLYSGCIDGNCIDGNGTWITVFVSGFGGTGLADRYLRNINLVYHITKGVFKDSGAVCRGEQTVTYYPLNRATEMDDYRPANPGQEVDTSTADLKKGEFDLFEKQYYSNGELNLVGKTEKYNYKKAVAWTQWGAIRYATIEYGVTDTFKTFTGIVDDYLRPVYGVANYQDGSVFNGFFIKNTTGPGYYFKNNKTENGVPRDGAEQFDFMPDLNLFREAFSAFRNGASQPIEVGWGDEEQEKEAGMPPVHIYRELVQYGGGSSGWIFGEDGKGRSQGFTGKGIYYYNENLFYFGSFDKGRPDGKGFLYLRHMNMDTIMSPSETFFKYGNFVQGFFNDGYFIYHKANLLARKALPQKTITEPSFLSLALEANKNNTPALVRLGDIYTEGKGVKIDVAKAISYYKRAVTYGDVQAAQTLGALYENGNGIPRDTAKAAYYYKRGAQMKVSPVAPAAAIKNCLIKYFLITYPYLTKEQAARFTLSDEYNFVSELSDLVRQNWKEKNANEKPVIKDEIDAETAKYLIDKIFFRREDYKTGRNKWVTVTFFYQVIGFEGNNASVLHSATNNVTVSTQLKPVKWFTDYNSGLIEAKKKYRQCRECNGSGTVKATSTFKHTNDYQYTLGKKITYTSTTTSYEKCSKCYGAGFCPVDGSSPEWNY